MVPRSTVIQYNGICNLLYLYYCTSNDVIDRTLQQYKKNRPPAQLEWTIK